MTPQEFQNGLNRLKAQFYKADPKPETIMLYWEKLQHWDAKRFMRAVNVIIDRSADKSVFDWPTLGDLYAAAPTTKNTPETPKPKRQEGDIAEFDKRMNDFLATINRPTAKGSK